MNEIRTYAHAKLMLAGEYSVLLGYPALVLALNRRAEASYAAHPTTRFFTNTMGTFCEDAQHPLFMALVRQARQSNLTLPVGDYAINTKDFFDGTRKLGIGSSAAACAGLARLLFKINKLDHALELFSFAQKIHVEFSHAQGSGADIAAALFGTLCFAKSHTQPHIYPLSLKNLAPFLVFIDTKNPQSSSVLVNQFFAFNRSNPEYVENFSKKSEYLVRQLMKDDLAFAGLKLLFDALYSELDDLGQLASMPIVTKPHRDIFALASSFGGSAKPSGAGGGDCAIAVIAPEHQRAFLTALTEKGYAPLTVTALEAV